MVTRTYEVRLPPVDRACVRCGYGIAALRAPDRCPMCGGAVWRPVGRPPAAR
ncbi:MAG TPA: hypothetical protein VFA66_16745 [Gaiellaceae bacterium]|nr:hypothetical protein [Gaiellaceae bacterium]